MDKIILEFNESPTDDISGLAETCLSDRIVALASRVVTIESGERRVIKHRDLEPPREARLLHLQRDTDVSGVSGTGIVAYGAQFPDGTIVLRWDTQVTSTVFYESLDDLVTITGHGGNTKVVFDS